MKENKNNLENNNQEENNNIERTNQVNTPPEVNTNNNQDLVPAKNGKPGLIAALVLIIAVLGVALAYVLIFSNKDDKKGNDTPTPTATPEETSGPVVTPDVTPTAAPNDEEEKNYDLTIYKTKDDGTITTATKADEYVTEAFKIKVANKNAKVLDVDQDNKFFIYSDNEINIYNIKSKNTEKTSLGINYEDYDIMLDEASNKVIGIAFRDKSDYVGYYNVKQGKELYYGNKYKKDDSPFIYQLNDNYLSLDTDDSAYLLSANEEKIVLSHKYTKDESDMYGYGTRKLGNKYIYMYSACYDDCITYKIYDDKFKEFYNGEVYESDMSYSTDYMYINEKNNIKKYNNSGSLVTSIDKYKDIKGFINNYVVYVNDGNLVLENMEDQTESKVILKWNNDYFYDYLSRMYTREDLDSMDEKNKKAGIYVVVYYSDSGSQKDANGNYGMEYCYNKGQELVEYPIKSEMGGRAKPVLYLYPEKETNVTVTFSHPEYLTTTYPKYTNSWNMTVKPNGDMKDKDGKYYYALYWDEKRYNEATFHEGFYVEGKDAIKFLEEKLSIIGLNDKERNEFIMYWLPIMEANKKNLVYFELTEERELGNKLIITPKPDSLLRVSIHIKKVNEKVNIKEQKLSKFTRSGFTAVEWGGMTY